MTDLTRDVIQQLQSEAKAALAAVTDQAALEAWRVAFLGRKGKLMLLLRQVKDVPAAARKTVGEVGNHARRMLEEAYTARKSELGQKDGGTTKKKSRQPVTYLSGLPEPGHLHPLTLTMRRIQRIFSELGFTYVEGPEVEEPTLNFDLLNIPPEHPARAETDTFYLESGKILRTHVSTLQIRGAAELERPPFKIFYYGRSFRAEKTDATHESTFNQFEFMVVSPEATLAQLKGIIETFYTRFFDQAVTIRLRPGYFPFVEPGLEVDISCVFCQGKGCRICKHSGWIEIAGAGMVHPQVLKNIGADLAEYRGFALGGALDRLAMLRYGIDNIRLFWSGDMKFLKQFS